MINIWFDNDTKKIIIATDDLSVKFFLEIKKETKEYIPWRKEWGTIHRTYKVYDKKKTEKGITYFQVGMGWIGLIANIFSPYIPKEMYDSLVSSVMSPTYRTQPFAELRDYQNQDVLHILKFKVGLFSCYTSYGKTQVIATLANYANTLGKSILLVTPGKKAQDELVKRCKNVFGLDVPSKDGRIDCMITSGLLNRKDYKDENQRQGLVQRLSQFQWILVDEVEYTINDAGKFIFDSCTGFENMYAFSGTSSKKDGKCINFTKGLDDEVVLNNMDLIKYFGPSLVFRLPLNLDITNISVRTRAFDLVDYSGFDGADENIYAAVMNGIFTNEDICKVIVKIATKYPRLYIPINNLSNIIDNWIDYYFLGKFRVLLICGEGYIYYDLHRNRRKLKDLQEAWNMVKNGEVDVIPSTSSGYRALDLPDLENVLLIQGKVAGVVLQAAGRTARGSHMNVISLLPGGRRQKIPVYTKGMEHRRELLKEYYKYCDIEDVIIDENDL